MMLNSYLKAAFVALKSLRTTEGRRTSLYGEPIASGPLEVSRDGYSSVGGVEFVGVSQRSFLDFRRRNDRIAIRHTMGYYILHKTRGGYVVRNIPEDHFWAPS